MAICMEPRSSSYTHGMMHTEYTGYHYDTFDSDFYKCLCEDLAKELDFPDETDLRRISQLELFGSSWETDPYKKLLLRCLDHSIPRNREASLFAPRSRGGSVDYAGFLDEDVNIMDLEVEEEAAMVPKVPPPSPVISPSNYAFSSERGAEDVSRQEPLLFDDFHLLQPAGISNEDEEENVECDPLDYTYSRLPAGEITEARRIREQQNQIGKQNHLYHRRVASTGLLATVVTGDGSIIWHFKEFS
ncbi:hypothetical protein H072_7742 [Dactylellina haptotyla CBS 200.50]|uniref:Uncharacterized protein n=1 Tax=Dactylellina haptotyla (strain CBS 200.50) TaxID=1284197 RepID=S8A6N7_DACHA|nr:hypothetical protein H072_7742 [Dactylellina haptotyla CBS 200.50]